MTPGDADDDRPGPRRPPATLWERTGGLTGLVQSSLPPTTLVIANAWWGLYPALAAALGTAVLVTTLRAARGQTLRPAIGGFVGVAVAGALAARSGEARDFFLADISWYFVATVVLTVSILLRRPLVGVVWSALRGDGLWWRHDRPSLHRYDLATAVLAAVFAARFLVLHTLYDHNEVGWMTIAKLAMNHPLWAVALLAALWATRHADHRHTHCREPVPDK